MALLPRPLSSRGGGAGEAGLIEVMGAGESGVDHAAMIRTSLLILAAAFLATSTTAPLAKGSPVRGRAIAEKNCQKCHAVGRTGLSRNPKSPPFRTLAQRYPLRDLEESFGEGVMVGHDGPEMPVFEFEPAQIEDLTAYLRTIQTKKR
jgi:cytochrome c